MHLTPEQTSAIRVSYALLSPEAERLSDRFYRDLFDRMPKLRAFFPDDMQSQGMRFMAAIGFLVDNLDDEEQMNHRLKLLAQGHAPFKLRPEAYREMQEALIDTIAEALGAKFTNDIELAWRSAFDQICDAMIEESGTALPK